MRYIKLFENFDEGFVLPNHRNSNDERFTIERVKIFSKREIEEIGNFLGDNVNKIETNLLTSIGFWMPYKDRKSTKKYISIDKFKDEWFLLRDYPHYYECDQMYGLLNCLKSLLPK